MLETFRERKSDSGEFTKAALLYRSFKTRSTNIISDPADRFRRTELVITYRLARRFSMDLSDCVRWGRFSEIKYDRLSRALVPRFVVDSKRIKAPKKFDLSPL